MPRWTRIFPALRNPLHTTRGRRTSRCTASLREPRDGQLVLSCVLNLNYSPRSVSTTTSPIEWKPRIERGGYHRTPRVRRLGGRHLSRYPMGAYHANPLFPGPDGTAQCDDCDGGAQERLPAARAAKRGEQAAVDSTSRPRRLAAIAVVQPLCTGGRIAGAASARVGQALGQFGRGTTQLVCTESVSASWLHREQSPAGHLKVRLRRDVWVCGRRRKESEASGPRRSHSSPSLYAPCHPRFQR